jgi:hypothetical protein
MILKIIVTTANMAITRECFLKGKAEHIQLHTVDLLSKIVASLRKIQFLFAKDLILTS